MQKRREYIYASWISPRCRYPASGQAHANSPKGSLCSEFVVVGSCWIWSRQYRQPKLSFNEGDRTGGMSIGDERYDPTPRGPRAWIRIMSVDQTYVRSGWPDITSQTCEDTPPTVVAPHFTPFLHEWEDDIIYFFASLLTCMWQRFARLPWYPELSTKDEISAHLPESRTIRDFKVMTILLQHACCNLCSILRIRRIRTTSRKGLMKLKFRSHAWRAVIFNFAAL